MDSKLINLTGLWKNKTKDGITYLSGNLSPRAKIMIFENKKKTQPSDPDYTVCLAPIDKKAIEKKDEKQGEEDIPF